MSRVERIGNATLYLGDCREILPALGIVDAIVTDPPYMFSTASAGAGKLHPWADAMNAAVWYSEMLRLCRARLGFDGGVIWWFLNWRTMPTLSKAAIDADMHIESLLVWDKQWIGPGGSKGLRPSYEMVALFCVAGGGIANRGLPDIWRHGASSFKPSGHPAEKPESLLSELVRESPGQSVLDPFMGSGTTGVACAKHDRQFVGVEMEPRYFDIACQRISDAYSQTDIFIDGTA